MARIAFTSTVLWDRWGGSEELWSQAALALVLSGEEVAAQVRRWPRTPERIAALERAGARIEWLHKGRPARQLASLLRDLLTARSWPPRHGWIRRFAPDLALISTGIHVEGADFGRACRSSGVPYAVLVQSAGEQFWPHDGLLDELRAFYENAARVYFVAEDNRRLVERQLAVRLPRSRVVWNPFNVAWDAAPAWPAGGERLKLACIGRHEPRAKGQDVLLDVLERKKWRERALSVSLFGGGPNERALAERARQEGLSSVEFRGFQPDVESIWSEHHALVLPSRYEGTPLVVVEAMLCGRPCIVSAVAGRDLVRDGETGFVACAPTPDLFDEALERAWQQRGDLQALGQRAAVEIRKRVPADPVGEFVFDLRELLQAPAG